MLQNFSVVVESDKVIRKKLIHNYARVRFFGLNDRTREFLLI